MYIRGGNRPNTLKNKKKIKKYLENVLTLIHVFVIFTLLLEKKQKIININIWISRILILNKMILQHHAEYQKNI